MPQSHTLSICCVNSCLKEQGEKTWICLMCFHTMKALTMLKHRLCVTLKVTGVFLCICPLSALSALRMGGQSYYPSVLCSFWPAALYNRREAFIQNSAWESALLPTEPVGQHRSCPHPSLFIPACFLQLHFLKDIFELKKPTFPPIPLSRMRPLWTVSAYKPFTLHLSSSQKGLDPSVTFLSQDVPDLCL